MVHVSTSTGSPALCPPQLLLGPKTSFAQQIDKINIFVVDCTPRNILKIFAQEITIEKTKSYGSQLCDVCCLKASHFSYPEQAYNNTKCSGIG